MEFGCAGSVARWADEGADVTVAVVTDGSTGTQDRELMGERLAAIRHEESQAAADVLGVKELVWMGNVDGYVEYTLELRKEIARLFRRYRPHRFVVMDPTPTIEDRFVNHPDHRAVGQTSLDVTLSAGTTPGHFPELLDEGLEPWRGLRDLYIAGPGTKPVAVDISATIERKIQALLCHRSQVGDNAEGIEQWVRQWSAEAGKAAGFEFAETFQVIAQGPGFHDGEQDEEVGDLPQAPPDPRANPSS
ncbi:MAG: PIG-L family deacetylase [Actinobacteria bacterium]|nr:PIG-L family deacetylase [Actinomycetota bacterium]